MKKWFCISLALMCLLLSCNKHISDEYPETTGCERYAGEYEMYDSMNQNTYYMTISCFSGVLFGQTKWDSVSIYNFANLFNYSQGAGINNLEGTIIDPLKDKNGNRWVFGTIHYPDTVNRINVMIKDSIYLYFHINNAHYYLDDSIPYQDIVAVHRGVKIH